MLPIAHGGNVQSVIRERGQAAGRLIDFSASINPLGLPRPVRRAIQRAIPYVVHYPEVNGQPVRFELAAFHGVAEDCLALGNGSAELIAVLPRALGSRHGLVIGPTFMEFERALRLAQADCTYVHAESLYRYRPPIERACELLHRRSERLRRQKGRGRPPIDTVFLCNPNSPTGQVVPRKEVFRLLAAVQKAGARLIVDEAFIDYCAGHSVFHRVGRLEELIVLRSFTKFYAIPGLRIGYVGGAREIINGIRSYLPPWSVNVLAAEAAIAAIHDVTYRQQSVRFMRQERKRFTDALRKIPGLRVYASSANFLMVQLKEPLLVEPIADNLRRQGLFIRNCENFTGITAPTFRLAVRRRSENNRMIKALTREVTRWR